MRSKTQSKLTKLRLKAKVSQNKLARLAKVDRKTISDLEGGRTNPQDVTLAKLAETLGDLLEEDITIDDIV